MQFFEIIELGVVSRARRIVSGPRILDPKGSSDRAPSTVVVRGVTRNYRFFVLTSRESRSRGSPRFILFGSNYDVNERMRFLKLTNDNLVLEILSFAALGFEYKAVRSEDRTQDQLLLKSTPLIFWDRNRLSPNRKLNVNY
jgi:hypothetical protein